MNTSSAGHGHCSAVDIHTGRRALRLHSPVPRPTGCQSLGVAMAAVALALLGMAGPARAIEPVTVRSQSGQFIVRGLPMGAPVVAGSTSAVEYLRLDPTLTAVSLERIRQTLSDELGLKERWRGLITVNVRPVSEDYPTAQIAAVRYTDGWNYQLDLPERIDRQRFIKVAVRVILMEVANRQTAARGAELPLWLDEGLSAELQHGTLGPLALEPETRIVGRELRPDPLRVAREVLRRRPALTFNELSLPLPEHLAEANLEVYRACAQIFVRELLRLRGGREALRTMLQRLPDNLNWQTTFLQAFSGHFPRLIDADKWYSLVVASVVGRDLLSRWPFDTTLAQLEEILATPVQVRLAPGELPLHTSVTLQRIVSEWEFAQQQPVLAQKVAHLQALHARAATELADLVSAYAQVLQTHANGRPFKLAPAPEGPRDLEKLPVRVRSVVMQLNELDARREKLRDRAARPATAP